MTKRKPPNPPLCPSAHTSAPGAHVFGVKVHTKGDNRQLAYLTETQPVTDQVLSLAGSAEPNEVLRVAANCIEGQCAHWDGQGCRLATRVATMMPQAVSAMPRCAIRPSCLWFRQEGPAARLRCPQLATIDRHARNDLGAAVAQIELRHDGAILKPNPD